MQEVGIGDAGADAGADDDDGDDGRYGSDWTGMDCGWRSSSRLGDRKLCAGEGDSSEQKRSEGPYHFAPPQRSHGRTGCIVCMSQSVCVYMYVYVRGKSNGEPPREGENGE